ncbi:MAG: hypothetical protein LBK29_01450 [Oscillospiraceae bacterium]|jgi:hypothetical protein|nr:hypothetical protein [Oscillospiraceae bacterium]
MKFKKFTALICAFAFLRLNLPNVYAENSIRVAVLGDPGVGKNQVVSRVCHGRLRLLKPRNKVVFHKLHNSANSEIVKFSYNEFQATESLILL